MLRKATFSLIVVLVSLLGASVAGAQQYPPSSMGTTASTIQEDVISQGMDRQDPPSVLGAGQVQSSPLARTGLDATTLGTIALVLFGGGAVLVAASRRPTRRV